jgi:YbgC/YbaW family acyl-CoA thioester hydrolase
MAKPSIETSEEVMFFDTDVGGVVHNIAYLRFIETCRTRLAVRLGMDLKSMVAAQQFPVVLRTEIDYVKPAVLGDILTVRGTLDEVGGVRFWCAFTITRPADGALLIRCRQALALVQMPAGKVLRLPEGFGHAMDA